MKRLPISVFIIARDEADRIVHTIESVRDWVDEMIVIDSGSIDETCAVAERLGARVVFHEWKGYGPQKVFGETLCRNDWLLNLDADEAVSPKLAARIQALFADGEPKRKGYSLRIRMLLPFQEKLPWDGVTSIQLRLYNKKFAGFKDSPVHDSVVMKAGESTQLLFPPVLHRSFRSLEHEIKKIDFYSTMQAEDNFKRGKRYSVFRLLFAPLFAFVRSYILRGYIWYGMDGLVQSYLYAFNRFIRLAKTRERFQKEAARLKAQK